VFLLWEEKEAALLSTQVVFLTALFVPSPALFNTAKVLLAALLQIV